MRLMATAFIGLLGVFSVHSYLKLSRFGRHHSPASTISYKHSTQAASTTQHSRKNATNTTGILANGYGKKLLEQILLLITDKNSAPIVIITRLQVLLKEEYNNLHHVHIVTLLQRCAKMNVPLQPVFNLKYFNEILARKAINWLPVEIAHSLYALKLYKPDSSGVDKYLDIIIDQLQKCDYIFSNQDICNSFYGLQNFYNSNVENRQISSNKGHINVKIDAILRLLTEKLKFSQAELSGQDISNILYGLRKMNNNGANNVINELFDLLAIKISHSTSCFLNLQGIALSLNGLQGMSSSNPGTLVILNALLPLIEESNDIMNEKCIGMSLMGLRNMKNDNPQVQQLLNILTVKVSEVTTPLQHSSFSSALYGLRFLSDNDPTSVKLLEVLYGKLQDGKKDKPVSPATIAHCLAGLQSMNGNQAITKEIVTFLNSNLIVNDENVYKMPWICRSFQGLHSMLHTIDSNPDVRSIVNKLTMALDSLHMNNDYVSMDDVGFLLYSFHNCTNESDDVNRVLSSVTKLLRPENKPRSINLSSPKAMSMSMYGLKCMQSNDVVCKLLNALRQRLGTLDAQSVGNILFGMQRFSSDVPQVRAFIEALTPKIAQVNEKLSGQEIANAFYGLQNFDSTSIEVNKLLKVLVAKLEESKNEVFTSQGIGNAISGFQSMSLADDIGTISHALGLFTDIIEANSLSMSARDISNAMFGLQGMTSDCDEVRAVIIALTEKMRNTTDIFTSRDIGYCLSGLSLMQNTVHDEVNEFIDELTIQTSRSELKGEPNLSFFLFDRGIKVKMR